MKTRTEQVQALIDSCGGSIYGSSSTRDVADWAYEVACNDTRLGYWEQALNEEEGGSVRTADVQGHIDFCGGDFWGSDPLVPVSDWQSEVASEETRLGYWEYALENRPRPWVLRNCGASSPSRMFWNGASGALFGWTDLDQAQRFADDEVALAAQTLTVEDGLSLSWLNIPLAEMMDSINPLDAMTDDLTAFVMRNELPELSADDLLVLDIITGFQRLYLEQFVRQWEQAEDADGEPSISLLTSVERTTVHLDLRVDYDLNGEMPEDMARNLRSAVEREIGNGALTGTGPAEVSEYSMDVLTAPEDLETLAVERLIQNGYDPLMAKAVARFGMMAPTDFIESIAGSEGLLRSAN